MPDFQRIDPEANYTTAEAAALTGATVEAVRAAVRAAVGFEPRFHHTPLAGLCPACAARAATTTEEGTHRVRAR